MKRVVVEHCIRMYVHAETCAFFFFKLPQMLVVVSCEYKLIFSCTLPSNLSDNVDYMTACQLTHVYRVVRRCSGEEWSCDRNQG